MLLVETSVAHVHDRHLCRIRFVCLWLENRAADGCVSWYSSASIHFFLEPIIDKIDIG